MNDTQNANQISDVIAKAATKGKFLDFRNNLTAARPDEYAMIHGIGGKKHAPRSAIKMMITDYSVTGKSKVVTANVPPEQIAYLLEVCKKNVGANGPAAYPDAAAILAQMQKETVLPANTQPNPLPEPVLAVPLDAMNALSGVAMPENAYVLAAMLNPVALPKNGPAAYIGISQRIVNLLSQVVSQKQGANGVDYSYTQDRVNSYKEVNGLCPVSTLTISRTGIRKDGSVSQMPWCVGIKNFNAAPVKQGNGMTSYNGRTIKDQTTEQMFDIGTKV